MGEVLFISEWNCFSILNSYRELVEWALPQPCRICMFLSTYQNQRTRWLFELSERERDKVLCEQDLVIPVSLDQTNVVRLNGEMKSCAAIGVLLVLLLQYEVVRTDSDSSDSSSSSSGEKKHKHSKTKHKYNYPAYPNPGYPPYQEMGGYPSYLYNPYMPYPPYPQMGGYPSYPYNLYMPPPPPPPPHPQQAPPPSMYPPGPSGYPGGYPPQGAPGQNPVNNPNAIPNQPQAQQPASGPGSGPAPNYPPGGSSVINHSLKVNKEYNEDGHHQSST